MNALFGMAFFWTCQTIGLNTTRTYTGDASGSGVTRSGIQWLKFQISTDNTTLTLADHGRIYDSSPSDNPWWYYFPSIMVNCPGDMVAGFSGSTATNYMSGLYSFRLSNGGSISPIVYQAGTTNSPARSGDYSATTLDPTDQWSFWTVQQYGAPYVNPPFPTTAHWGTSVAKIRP